MNHVIYIHLVEHFENMGIVLKNVLCQVMESIFLNDFDNREKSLHVIEFLIILLLCSSCTFLLSACLLSCLTGHHFNNSCGEYLSSFSFFTSLHMVIDC
jgi:hypothetical protein